MQRLPVELERFIFENVAQSNPSTIPSLLRVARRVHSWLEPLLYRTLITDNSSKGHALKQFIYTKPSGFFREHTHNLYLTSAGKWSEDYVRDLLQLCPQLTALAVSGIWGNPQQELVKQIGGVRRWSGFLYSLFGTSNLHAIDFSRCACFSNVTHMDIFDTFEDDDDLFICPALAGLPALTHLCLMDATPSVLTLVAEACPRLQVLVYMPSILDEARAIAEEPPFAPVDPRFVVSRLRLRLFWADWELFGTSAGFWAAADAFVARKRKGEINESTYWLEYKWPVGLIPVAKSAA